MDERGAKREGGGRLLVWVPALAWASLIFVFSAQPDLRFTPDETLDFVVRKAGHMAVFGVLAVLIWFALARTTAGPRPWLVALALTVAYAVTDELHQAGVVGRVASPLDVAFDTVGAVAAIVAMLLIRDAREGRRSSARPHSSGEDAI